MYAPPLPYGTRVGGVQDCKRIWWSIPARGGGAFNWLCWARECHFCACTLEQFQHMACFSFKFKMVDVTGAKTVTVILDRERQTKTKSSCVVQWRQKKELVEATRRVFADILAPEDDVFFQVGHYYNSSLKIVLLLLKSLYIVCRWKMQTWNVCGVDKWRSSKWSYPGSYSWAWCFGMTPNCYFVFRFLH